MPPLRSEPTGPRSELCVAYDQSKVVSELAGDDDGVYCLLTRRKELLPNLRHSKAHRASGLNLIVHATTPDVGFAHRIIAASQPRRAVQYSTITGWRSSQQASEER